MGLPQSVQTYLDEKAINFDVNTQTHTGVISSGQSPDVKPSSIARLVLLQDSLGIMQVLVPLGSVLDLSLLCELLGRNLQALSDEEQDKVVNDLGVEKLPGLPLLKDYDTLIEGLLLKLEKIHFHSGIDDTYISLSQKQFTALTQQADVAAFTKSAQPALDQLAEQAQMADDEKHIQNAVEQFTSLRIKQRLINTIEVPPMPDSAERIIRLRVDPDAGVGELAKVIETDPSLAAQVVSWAASPFYAAPGKITSVHDAVVRVLGFDLVINLALGLALGKTLAIPQDGPKGVKPYWQQAIYTAATMEALVRKLPEDRPCALGMAYLSGLLSNFGYLILAHVFPPHFSLISRYSECNQHLSQSVIDQHLIGVTREQIASWLMGSWTMPEEVVTALRWQANPNYVGNMSVYSNLLFLTKELLCRQGLIQGPQQVVPEALYQRLGIDEAIALNVVESILAKASDIEAMAQQIQ